MVGFRSFGTNMIGIFPGRTSQQRLAGLEASAAGRRNQRRTERGELDDDVQKMDAGFCQAFERDASKADHVGQKLGKEPWIGLLDEGAAVPPGAGASWSIPSTRRRS